MSRATTKGDVLVGVARYVFCFDLIAERWRCVCQDLGGVFALQIVGHFDAIQGYHFRRWLLGIASRTEHTDTRPSAYALDSQLQPEPAAVQGPLHLRELLVSPQPAGPQVPGPGDPTSLHCISAYDYS